MNPERVYFFSKYDGASFSNLEMAEKILVDFDKYKNYDINDIIELYQIKLYIDNEVYLSKWTKEDIIQIKSKIKNIWSIIVIFWKTINSENVFDLFNQLECWTIQKTFWELTANLSIYKNINKDTFANLLKSKEIDVIALLYQEKIVNNYSQEIREFLISYNKSAELILSQYVEKHDIDRDDIYFPKCLNLIDREKIISQYLDNKNANINYVRLIINIKNNSDYLQISDKTLLKAKRLEKKLNDDFFSENKRINFGFKIIFDDKQINPFEYSKQDEFDILSYSTQYITKIDHPIYYLNIFNSLFYFLNEQGCISMVSKKSDLGVIERLLVSSKNEYQIGIMFNRKNNVSLSQIFLYDKLLIERQKQSIDNLLRYHIVEIFNTKFNLNGFQFNLPTFGTNYLEKIRILLAEFDSLLKQYKLFKEEGEIDLDLFRVISKPNNLSEIPSFVTKKYCYLRNGKLDSIMYLLFSDQSHLTYVDPFKKSKYNCLYNLISNEDVLFENYKSYQLIGLNLLLEKQYLFVDNNGYLKIKDTNRLFILSQLNQEDVLSYWHYSKECRRIINDMANDNLLYFEDTLFTKNEQDYFNYYLNKKKFTNGLDLRNSFMHGTNPNSDVELTELYYIFLRIIVLTVLKIIDDQFLRQKMENSFKQD